MKKKLYVSSEHLQLLKASNKLYSPEIYPPIKRASASFHTTLSEGSKSPEHGSGEKNPYSLWSPNTFLLQSVTVIIV
jgi:hypothetical protein